MTTTTQAWDAVPVTLLDGPHALRFTHGAVKRLEKQVGKPFEEFLLVSDTTDNAMLLLWCGLIHEDKTLTPEQVEELVDVRMYPQVRVALMEAFSDQAAEPPGNAVSAEGDGAVSP